MEIYNKVLSYIQTHNLINKNDRIICAVSGGADSICLLKLLTELQKVFSLELFVAHLNHQLRGSEADRDELFVEEFAKKCGLPFYKKRVDVHALSKALKVSCEEAGRIARYGFFEDLKKELNADKIATAHNKNDNAETVLMRLIRGTDIKGLSGIPVSNANSVIRPILCLTRSEIEDYLSYKNTEYVNDSTNFENIYMRNKIRNELIPHIESDMNPNFISVFTDNIELFGEAERYISEITSALYKKLSTKDGNIISFSLPILLSEDSYVVKRIIKKSVFDLSEKNISNELCNLIYTSMFDAGSVTINSDITFYAKYDRAYFVKKTSFDGFSYHVSSYGCHQIAETDFSLDVTSGEGSVDFGNKNILYLDADKVDCNFVLRSKKPGDRIFLPNCGTKKIKDIFIDAKVPVFLRDNYPILEYNGQVIWICGIRDNGFFRAKPNKKYIKLSIHKENDHE